MDNNHVSHGKGSSCSSWARLSKLWVWLSSPDNWWRRFLLLHLSCRQSYFDLFLSKFQKILTLDIPLRVPLVIHLNLLLSSKILHEFDEGIWLLQLFHRFLSVENFDLWAWFILRSKTESLLLPIDVELDYSNSRINVCSCHAQEWPPQYERDPSIDFHVENGKINGNKRNSIFSPEYPWRSPRDDELIGLLAANTWQ